MVSATAQPAFPTTGRGTPSSPVRRYLLATGLALVMTLPAVGLAFTPYGAAMGASVCGFVIALLSVLVAGPRQGLALAVAGPAVIAFGTLGINSPALGTAIIVAMGLATGLAARHGLDLPVYTIAWLLGMFMIGPTPLTTATVNTEFRVDGRYALTLFLIVLSGSLWTWLCICFLTRRLPPRPLVGLPPRSAVAYGVILAVLTGAVALVALRYFPYTLVGWVILTVYIIIRPSPGGDLLHPASAAPVDQFSRVARRKVFNRAVGTIIGVAVASLIASLIHSTAVLVLIGVLLVGPAMAIKFNPSHPYWHYVALFTPAMVFLDSSGIDVPGVGLERVVCTFIGLALALIGVLVYDAVLSRNPASAATDERGSSAHPRSQAD